MNGSARFAEKMTDNAVVIRMQAGRTEALLEWTEPRGTVCRAVVMVGRQSHPDIKVGERVVVTRSQEGTTVWFTAAPYRRPGCRGTRPEMASQIAPALLHAVNEADLKASFAEFHDIRDGQELAEAWTSDPGLIREWAVRQWTGELAAYHGLESLDLLWTARRVASMVRVSTTEILKDWQEDAVLIQEGLAMDEAEDRAERAFYAAEAQAIEEHIDRARGL